MRTGAPPAIAFCALCGGWFGDDQDGRRAHRTVTGHTARTADEQAEAQAFEEEPPR